MKEEYGKLDFATKMKGLLFAILALGFGIAAITLFAFVGVAVLGGVVIIGLIGLIAAKVMPYMPKTHKKKPEVKVHRDREGVIIDM